LNPGDSDDAIKEMSAAGAIVVRETDSVDSHA